MMRHSCVISSCTFYLCDAASFFTEFPKDSDDSCCFSIATKICPANKRHQFQCQGSQVFSALDNQSTCLVLGS